MRLKPCPFCGRAAELESSTAIRKAKKTEVFRVECSGCHVRDNYWHTSCRAAARAWNTRDEPRRPETNRFFYVKQQGEWVDNTLVCDLELSCGHTIAWVYTFSPHYCPICGAKNKKAGELLRLAEVE